ncbi:hypothetical protein HHK36_018217 [Tetracentron sinense]|uniref:FAS1 domain-containing protein n=1 Tax=Tetracentron sinense TaxID=13715 RepID=A0A834Z1V7_TETSI|nr:hypothetical protein HHK36_018217 [Tetracentron sinense]
MMKQLLLSLFSALLVFFLHCTTTLAQSPAVSPALPPVVLSPPQPPALSPVQLPVPSPPQPPALSPIQIPLLSPALSPGPAPSSANVTAILEKAGKFNTLIWLLGNTKVGDQINTQISTSGQGITLFAPNDKAFSRLKSGTLNALSTHQTIQLVQFHVLPTCISLSQFQAVSNPLRTQAGLSDSFLLNVTASSSNQVSISTGLVNATVTANLYTDNQLAVYEVDKVLLPLQVFSPKSPAPAPVPSSSPPPPPSPQHHRPSSITSVDDSSATSLIRHAALSFGVAAIAAFSL